MVCPLRCPGPPGPHWGPLRTPLRTPAVLYSPSGALRIAVTVPSCTVLGSVAPRPLEGACGTVGDVVWHREGPEGCGAVRLGHVVWYWRVPLVCWGQRAAVCWSWGVCATSEGHAGQMLHRRWSSRVSEPCKSSKHNTSSGPATFVVGSGPSSLTMLTSHRVKATHDVVWPMG